MGRLRLRVKGAVPAILTANVVSGVVGGTLTNTPGTYTNNPTITRQWQNKIGAAYANIAGQTGTTLASVYATHGNNIRCLETATNPVSGGAVSQSALAQYLGQVATNCKVLTNIDTNDTALMSRSPHYSTDSITSLQLVFANWYWDDFPTKTELGSGGNMTAAASIEYPVGTFTQILFGGLTTSAAVASGNNLISDAVSVTIPANTQFWVRCYMTYAAGILYQSGAAVYDPTNNTVNLNGNGSSGGHAMVYTAPTNQTMSGTVTAQSAGNNAPSYVPLAIIANTRVPSVALLGDSITDGLNDKYDSDNTIGFGRFLAHLSPKVGFIQLSGEGETVANQKANFAKRGVAIQWVSHLDHEGGVNDMTAAVSGATHSASATLTNLTGAGGLLTVYAPNTPCYQATIIPPVTSTDSWATLANQTVDGDNAQRVSFNNTVRGGGGGFAGYLEFADILESSRDSGKRLTNGTANAYQSDSIHPTRAAMLLVRDAPLITTATFVR